MTRALALVVGLLAGCTPARLRTPFPPPAATITVAPPQNRTADPLVVAGDSVLERALGTTRITVPDVLVDEAAAQLRARGYSVQVANDGEATGRPRADDATPAAAPAHGVANGGLTLYLEIRRWEPDDWTHPAFVIVGVAASLVETSTGREIWSARPPIRPVPTAGSILRGVAYTTAARTVVDEMLDLSRR